MEYIPYEKINLKDAVDGAKERPEPVLNQNWPSLRGDSAGISNEVLPHTRKWLGSIPHDVRPNWLVKEYPRIANRLADLWFRTRFCENYLKELTTDHRGNRKGFPLKVVFEIDLLKTFFETQQNPVRPDVWGDHSNR